jgi:glycosyltransferase involved in cell wall biosynthesis
VCIIIIYTLILIILSNRRIKEYKKLEDPDEITISDFKTLPLVNIIIPAWKEGEFFKNLLHSIKEIKYPSIKVIVNAGGSDETIKIANSFKKFENFVILRQEGGSDRASMGKIKAINECLSSVSEGILYFIDADSELNEEILLRMIYPIVNLNEDIVLGGNRPLKNQMKNPLVKYLLFDRYRTLIKKFKRHYKGKVITGANFCINYDVFKSIGKFTVDHLVPTDRSMGKDLFSKDYRAYRLVDFRHRIYVDYPSELREYLRQRLIWNENYLYKNFKLRSYKNIIKFLLLWSISIYSLIFPFLFLIDFRLLFPGLLIYFTIYMKKLRRLFVFTKAVDKKYYNSYRIKFFFYLVFFIFFEMVITSYVLFHFVYFVKMKLKKS